MKQKIVRFHPKFFYPILIITTWIYLFHENQIEDLPFFVGNLLKTFVLKWNKYIINKVYKSQVHSSRSRHRNFQCLQTHIHPNNHYSDLHQSMSMSLAFENHITEIIQYVLVAFLSLLGIMSVRWIHVGVSCYQAVWI